MVAPFQAGEEVIYMPDYSVFKDGEGWVTKR
jgi:hypothetical protein